MPVKDIHFANLNMSCQNGGYFSIGKGAVWRLHNNKFSLNKFYYILDGECTINIEGHDYKGLPGRWFFIPAGTLHRYENDTTRSFSKYWIHFDITPDEIDLFSSLNLPLYIDLVDSEQIDALFERFTKIMRGRTLTDKLQVKSILFSLLSIYIQLSQTGDVGISSSNDTRGEELIQYIHDHMTMPLSNSHLAERFHLDPRSFIRYFKKLTGYSPAKYILMKRMERAKKLLEESDLSVSEIMWQVGFDDLSHFSKLFKKHYSLSPRSYRALFQHSA